MNDVEKLAEAFKDHAANDERNFSEIHKELQEIKALLKPLTEAYAGVLFSKQFLMGAAGVVLAIGAIGGGLIWIINAAIRKT